ncbi:MAG: RNA pseudouridine synthase [Bacteroidaceae bacterium]|nr:RNA pseudouridine synthase [Bacteroidaceae bacterium]MBR4967357.1 RNA pseudouridine synthase [Bacteroidaceae bacterium]
MKVLYEDNHIIVINKAAGEIVQGDKTGDESLCDTMKRYIKEKYAKPGNVFIGLPHRLDRPVSGIVVFAKTSKALERLNRMFSEGGVKKIYWALTKGVPVPAEAELESWILRNEKMNKSFSYPKEVKGSKRALLHYRLAAASQNYNLIEVELKTGRHHQIRCQLSSIGCPIKGDLKYGAQRSNPDGSISLHARYIEFTHPVSKEVIAITAPLPDDRLWQSFENI